MKQLLVFSLDGVQCGVWNDPMLSIRDLQPIHKVPLSPPYIAGICVMDDRTITVADLPACIGFPPINRKKYGQILLFSEQDRPSGFVIEGQIDQISVAEEIVIPVPDYFKTAAIETCAVINNSILIPIIRIAHLSACIHTANLEPFIPPLKISGNKKRNMSLVKHIRIFDAGNESFAGAASDIQNGSTPAPRIVRLPHVPRFIKGMAFQHGRIIPIISLAEKLELLHPGTHSLILQAEIDHSGFGFLIDADENTMSSADVLIRPLPLLIQCCWMRAAVIRQGEILPVIDLGALISTDQDNDAPLWERYTPDSPFNTHFGRDTVEVVEFFLLGARHALPKMEVVETVRLKPYRQVPNVQPIVVGVAEHERELVPVLDLAMCFGRRSLTGPDWQMILIKNGDFRAFVITEAVFDERRLAPEMHREVPMVLPHRVVYGCYPDATAVKLILNVEALAVHFDKSLVKGLLPALSKGMEQAPAEIVPSLLEPEYITLMDQIKASALPKTEQEQPEKGGEQSTDIREEKAQREPEPALTAAYEAIDQPSAPLAPDADRIQEIREPLINSEIQEPAPALSKAETESEPKTEQELSSEPEDIQQPQSDIQPAFNAETTQDIQHELGSKLDEEPAPANQPQPEPEPKLGQQESESRTEPDQKLLSEEKIEFKPEQQPESETGSEYRLESIPESMSAEKTAPESQESGEPEPESPGTEPHEAVVQSQISDPEETPHDMSDVQVGTVTIDDKQVNTQPAPQDNVVHREHEQETLKQELQPEEQSANTGALLGQELSSNKRLVESIPAGPVEYRDFSEERTDQQPKPLASNRNQPDRAHDYRKISGRIISDYVFRTGQTGLGKNKYVYMVLAILVIIILFFSGIFRKPSTIQETMRRPQAETTPVVEKTNPEPKGQARKPIPTEPPKPVTKAAPSTTVSGSTFYRVKAGDTLWDIAERFTGNPYNYARIALENNIENPDLIYPGQEIRL